jgi:hypothetical protein
MKLLRKRQPALEVADCICSEETFRDDVRTT